MSWFVSLLPYVFVTVTYVFVTVYLIHVNNFLSVCYHYPLYVTITPCLLL